MSLMKCPSCNTEVSSTALTCPKCGHVLRKPKRSLFGKLCLWSFYIWNALMILWIVSGLNEVSNIETSSDVEQAGVAIGAGIGMTIIITIWVVGDIITGLFALLTRPKI